MIDALQRSLRILVGVLIIATLAPANSLPKKACEQAMLEAYVTAAINTIQFMAARRMGCAGAISHQLYDDDA